jgi:flagellar hook protein FlgE
MSLFGSLFTGVSGLGAQSQATAIISNNIANVSTVGFKSAEASFSSLVTSESRLTTYSPGTVDVNRLQNVDQQGPIQQTSSATDAAIAGNGMFVVKREASDQQEFLYTRAGQFREDSVGNLRNTAGMVLYGWALDPVTGALPSALDDLNSLEPVDVAFLGGVTQQTTAAEIALNLDANETNYDLNVLGATLPINGITNPTTGQASNFTRGVTVYDSLGNEHVINLEFRKIHGPMATATTTVQDMDSATVLTDTSIFPGIAPGDQFSIDVGAVSETVELVAGIPSVPPVNPGVDVEVRTMGELLTYLNEGYDSGTAIDASLDEEGRLVLQVKDTTNTLTLTDVNNTPLSAGGLNFLNFVSGFAIPPITQATTYPDNFTPAPPGETIFPAITDESVSHNSQGWWEVAVVFEGVNLGEGLINFNSDGSLNASSDVSGDIDIQLTNIQLDVGADLQDISIDIERFTQFAGNYNVVFIDQDGTPLGERTGVEITRDGTVKAQFSNGSTRDIYKLPLALFPSVNNLTEVSGTAYKESDESGTQLLKEAGQNGAGFFEAANIETSNVDLADEFAKLIIAQRAYSANTKIINTVDEMTEELLRLR